MSARRRNQARDRLGRFTPGRRGLPGRPLRARVQRTARRALAATLAALRSELARRLGRLALVCAALAGAVVLLYQHSDTPAALARPAVATTLPAPRAAAATTTTTTTLPAPRAPGRAAPRRPDATRPSAVAAAWYAARNHLPAGKVRALQQDVVSQREVRVLVLADRGGRLDTALVTVRRNAAESWAVP